MLGTKAIDVECPRCGAVAGERCVLTSLRFTFGGGVHRDRIAAAAKQTRDANAEARR